MDAMTDPCANCVAWTSWDGFFVRTKLLKFFRLPELAYARRAVYHELIDAIHRGGREGARRAVSIHRTVLRPLLAEFNIAVETGRRRTSGPSNV